MLSPTSATWRLALHILAATIWVGGQFALAGVVPSLRRVSPDATRAAARAFARVAWPAFFVLVVTGKGSSSKGDGVLRRVVPEWLATPAFRSVVSSHDGAARHHGGGGALYIRLRRQGVR